MVMAAPFCVARAVNCALPDRPVVVAGDPRQEPTDDPAMPPQMPSMAACSSYSMKFL
jgi:hypothetical protein